MTEKLKISKRGEDGHKVFSVRIREYIVEELDSISQKTNRSRNELINIMLEFGIRNCEITDSKYE